MHFLSPNTNIIGFLVKCITKRQINLLYGLHQTKYAAKRHVKQLIKKHLESQSRSQLFSASLLEDTRPADPGVCRDNLLHSLSLSARLIHTLSKKLTPTKRLSGVNFGYGRKIDWGHWPCDLWIIWNYSAGSSCVPTETNLTLTVHHTCHDIKRFSHPSSLSKLYREKYISVEI